jgi:hypothetical protein
MKRMLIGALLGLLAFGASVDLAHAGPKKKGPKKAQQQQQEAPQSAEIGNAMGDLKWGASRDEVLGKFVAQIQEKYRPQLAKATGAIEEDRIRAKMREEIARLKDSVVDFNGRKTGWDVSFLKGEFTHHNAESLFVVKDETSQNYYFFIQGRLWKWYKAFNADVFKGKSFDQFAEAIQGRYGRARATEGEVMPGAGKQRWLEWQNAGTRLRAVDNNQFYGFYCLVFESKDTLARLAELRTHQGRDQGDSNALVDSVTGGDDEEADANQDIVDRITGKIRRRQDAPEDKDKKKGTASSAPAPARSEPTDGQDSSDPLRGLF